MSIRIRPCVERMKPYSPGKPVSDVRRELGLTHVYKLASNENPLGVSPKVAEAIRHAAEEVHLYPDAAYHDLKHAVCAKFDVPAENVYFGNGSDECIRMLGWVMLDQPSDEVIVGDPSFVCYDETANLADCVLKKIPLDADQRHDLDAMARAITENTRIVFIANPNNPTGTIVRKPELDAFFARVPDHVLVVLDEAYFEFAEEDSGYPNGLDYVKAGKSVCALRTFSKTYGLAGLRCGYAFGPGKLVDAINKARQPFHVNAIAQRAAIAALADQEHLRRTIENNRRGLSRLSEILEGVGAKTCESYANFVYAELDRPAQPVFEQFLKQGIIIRTGDPFGRPNGIRVSVGTDGEIDAFEDAAKDIFAKVSAE